jgi:diguanylate cyclase (GGDEF)-like protein/PAS domain S-box-containing protein
MRLMGEVPMPVTLRDFDGRFQDGNANAEALFGGRPVAGRHAAELLDERAAAVLAENASSVQAGERSITCEVETTLTEGPSRSFLVTDYPVHAEDGRTLGVGSIWLDVTERTRADHRFRDLLESQADAIVIVNDAGEIVLVNEQTVKMFGYTREELISAPVEILLPRDLRERHSAYRDRYSANPHLRPMGTGHDLCARRKDGTEFPVEVSLSMLTSEDCQLITGRIADITARKQAEADLQEAEEHFRLAFESTPIGMALVALDGHFVRVNRALCEITGHPEQRLLASTLQDITHPDDVEADLDKLQELIAGKIRAYQTERRHLNAFGHAVWSTLSVSLVRDGRGDPIHFITQLEDISERKLMEDRLRRLADYDSLTGVRNRRQFEHDLAFQINRCQRYGEQAAMLMIDLDGFKEVNDTYGHRAGDEVLKAVANAIRKRLRSTDTVARLGGDEFAVLLPHISPAKATAVADELVRCIAGIRINAGAHIFSPRASIGVADIDESARGKDAILAEADEAMYTQKRARRNRGEDHEAAFKAAG